MCIIKITATRCSGRRLNPFYPTGTPSPRDVLLLRYVIKARALHRQVLALDALRHAWDPGLALAASISCPNVPWLEKLADFSYKRKSRRPILINVGANKGYMLAMWMALFTQRPGFSPRFGSAWHAAIQSYAHAEHKGALMSQRYLSCGVCGACHGRTAAAHARDGGEAHALEILDSNVRLMRAVAGTTQSRRCATPFVKTTRRRPAGFETSFASQMTTAPSPLH